jgi:acyl-CoA synthetase (AMP-forming)/AMP-acid ligase II
MYGPTECAVVSSLVDVGKKRHPNDIGNPLMSNYWIVDAQDRNMLLPVGAVGELIIDGPVLAGGYLGDAAKTAASFIEETPRWLRLLKDGYQRPRRMYKTGDLVRYDANGALIYMGSKQSDMQAKLRGLRSSSTRLSIIFVRLCGITSRALSPSLYMSRARQMLVAFLADAKNSEAHGGGSSDKDLFDVDAATRSRLASIISKIEGGLTAVMHSSMITSAYIPVHCIPMSTTAKTNRALLRRLVSRLSISQLNTLKVKVVEKHIEPSTPMERQLQEIGLQFSAWSGIPSARGTHSSE